MDKLQSAEEFANRLVEFVRHNSSTPVASWIATRDAAVAAQAYAQGVEDASVMAERAAKFGMFTDIKAQRKETNGL